MGKRIEYTSPNGFRGVLYGESSLKIYDPDGKMCLHTGYRSSNTLEELKIVVDGMPELMRIINNPKWEGIVGI